MNDRPYTSYFVVGAQRSGTTVTHHCLRGHPAVSALYDELALDPFFTDGLSTFTTESSGTNVEQEKGRRSLFNALTEPERTSNTRACGVKCAFGYGAQGHRFVDVVQREFPSAKIIHVVRRNQVALFGSRVRAQETGIYHREGENDTMQGPTLTLDPYRFVSHMLDVHGVNASLRQLQETHDVLTIEYEADILNGELRSNRSLFSFVGVEPQNATWLQQRKVSPPPEEYISNYDELRELEREVEEQLNADRSPSRLRKKYSPPLLKSLYRTGKFWLDHPGYAAYRVGKGVKDLLHISTDGKSSL